MMRVTFVLPPIGMSGGIKVAGIYAKGLVDKGHQVSIVAPRYIPPLRAKLKSFFSGKGWIGYQKPVSYLDEVGLAYTELESYREVEERDVPDADIVIATWWATAEWVDRFSPSKGAKIYLVQGHEVFDNLPLERCKATYRRPFKKIVISRWLSDIMRDDYGDNDCTTINNAVDHAQFFSSVRGKQASPTVGFLYNPSPVKGVDMTIRVLRRLMIRFPSLRVIAFGSESPEPDYFENLPIEFHQLPPQHILRELYSACDVWVTASRSEGFNMTAMEAMACRTPVVATRTGWPVEGVVSQYNGMLVDVDDEENFLCGVEWVLSLSDKEWMKLSENAFDSVRNSTWQNAIDKFEGVLLAAIGKSNAEHRPK